MPWSGRFALERVVTNRGDFDFYSMNFSEGHSTLPIRDWHILIVYSDMCRAARFRGRMGLGPSLF